MKKVLMMAVASILYLSVNAQDDNKDYTPKEGDFTVAATVGYNSYTSTTAPSGLLGTYEVAALSTNWAGKGLMVGFEGSWFVNDLWKLSLGGGFGFTANPGYTGVPGTFEEGGASGDEVGDGSIPNYRAVGSGQSMNYNVSIGGDRYFKFKNVSNLVWYAGARVGFAYANNQVKFDEETSMGKSVAETWNLRGAITAGIEYYITQSLFVGAQIDPFAYTYNMTTVKPQEGLSNLDADSHNFNLLAAPTIKFGFKF